MRRLACFVISLVVLALATTVAVAWVFASFTHKTAPAEAPHRIAEFSSSRHSALNGWRVSESFAPGIHMRLLSKQPELNRRSQVFERLRSQRRDDFEAPCWSAANRPPSDSQMPIFEDMRGWPLASLRCSWSLDRGGFQAQDEMVTGGIPIAAFDPDWLYVEPVVHTLSQPDMNFELAEERRALPLIPLWRGLLFSTFLYMTAWFLFILLLSMPGALRRRVRQRRRRCVRCAYSLQAIESPRCPECGWERARRYPILTTGRLVITVSLALLVIVFNTVWAVELRRRLEGPSALHLAARDNDVTKMRRELGRGVSPNLRLESDLFEFISVENSTPLMWAAAHGSRDAMQLLINHSADVDATRRDQFGSALSLAVRGSHANAVTLLLRSGATASPYLASSAATSSSCEVLQALVSAGLGRDEAGVLDPSLLANAARAGDLTKVEYLLGLGADASAPPDFPPLRGAAQTGSLEIVRVLLDHGARADLDQVPMLWEAAENGHTDVAQLLIEAGADVNIARQEDYLQGWTPLRRAVLNINLELVELLLEAGADPMVRDKEGRLPIDLAREQLDRSFRAFGPIESMTERRIAELLQEAMEDRD